MHGDSLMLLETRYASFRQEAMCGVASMMVWAEALSTMYSWLIVSITHLSVLVISRTERDVSGIVGAMTVVVRKQWQCLFTQRVPVY